MPELVALFVSPCETSASEALRFMACVEVLAERVTPYKPSSPLMAFSK